LRRIERWEDWVMSRWVSLNNFPETFSSVFTKRWFWRRLGSRNQQQLDFGWHCLSWLDQAWSLWSNRLCALYRRVEILWLDLSNDDRVVLIIFYFIECFCCVRYPQIIIIIY
jgi:hypothetical protein